MFAQTKLQSPNGFLPYQLGTEFTPHHLLVDYFEHCSAARPDQVKLMRMGETWEHRPQILVAISSPENMARLEDIRLNNLRRTGFEKGVATDEDITFVWLGFSVHGNEPAGSEASMLVIYDLLSKPECVAWLKNTVVLIDPSQNPDGYSRYTHWSNNVSHANLSISGDTREHQEPWPGGRVNHYYFDLNRDWAWQTQIESKNRIASYHLWLPHVVADIHEQGPNAPYYFAPAVEPYHELITPWQRGFQKTIGRNNATYFDKEGWLYFTREVFDLFYPSYGDTYPTYHGAIGMTFEQGGIGAGRGYLLDNGDTLTLFDRIQHHRTTALSTVEVSSKNAKDLVKNFAAYYHRANNDPTGKYHTFILPRAGQSEGRLRALTALLDANCITYGCVSTATSTVAYDYTTGHDVTISVKPSDLVISTKQPASVLAQILLEPISTLSDSATYDITAWSLPYAYGLQAYASTKSITVEAPFQIAPITVGPSPKPYAYLGTWNALNNAQFLSDIIKQGVRVRFAQDTFEVDGNTWTPGTLLLTRGENLDLGTNFDDIVRAAATKHQQPIGIATTGMVSRGYDFGSSHVVSVQTPKIAVLYDDETDNNSYGHIWYFLERELNYPFTSLNTNQINDDAIAPFNTIIVTERGGGLETKTLDALQKWVSKGGRLVILNEALTAFEGKSQFDLKRLISDSDKADAAQLAEITNDQLRFAHFCDQEQNSITKGIPGAIYQTKLDYSHPLTFGLSRYYTLRNNRSSTYPPQTRAWNVCQIADNPLTTGFTGATLKPQLSGTMVLSDQTLGRGHVIYMGDSPLFRCFWYQGKIMFSNVLFFSGY